MGVIVPHQSPSNQGIIERMFSKKTYYIFRHGETKATLKGRGYGFRNRSARILEIGKPVIEEMAQFLKDIPSDYNVSSEYIRCQETAEIITNIANKQFVFDKRLNEFFFETFSHMRRRVREFLDEMEGSNHQTILVCSHGAILAGLISFLTKGEYPASDLTSYPPPGILIKIENGKVEQWDFNQTK